MNAALITIGNEILSGNTVDTNSNYIANQLNKIGINVKRVVAIQDEIQTIKDQLDSEFINSDLVITTGGLGPTNDDVTKNAIAQYFGDSLILDEETYHHLENILRKRNREHLLKINSSQAEVLKTAKIFQNDYGTAPCQLITKNNKTVICFPGVPFEMKRLLHDKVIPYLQNKFTLPYIANRIITIVGVPESLLAQKIEDWENKLPNHIQLSYLPIGNRIKLKLSGISSNKTQLENEISEYVEDLKPLIGENVIAWEGNEIQEILKEILLKCNMTLSVSESCTGGELSKLITSVSGSSKYYVGGLVAYHSESKINALGVRRETIEQFTTVSAEVSEEMSVGCQKLFGTDISISTTGVAGPNTDEFNNVIGKVFYTIRIHNNQFTNSLHLPYLNRIDFMNFVAQRVLQDVIELILKENLV